jgi:epoxyqueuosine reductase
MDPQGLHRHIHELARRHSFDRCGVAAVGPVSHRQYLREWLNAGHAGSMAYMYRHFKVRADSSELLAGARSMIVVALSYHQKPPKESPNGSSAGRIAMYAWGKDYHRVLKRKLFAFVDELRSTVDTPFDAKVCVDTAPVVEREAAALAGIGWIGKNTLILHQDTGSYVFLGTVVTTLEVMTDEPVENHCGTCTACLDACPTRAFPAPYQMDASRCISYLTIEHRGAISKPYQEMMGDWLFGCDVCQQVCPFNRDAPLSKESGFAVRTPAPAISAGEVCNWSSEEYEGALAGSAMKRATRSMLQRNALIVQENATRTRNPSETQERSQRRS